MNLLLLLFYAMFAGMCYSEVCIIDDLSGKVTNCTNMTDIDPVLMGDYVTIQFTTQQLSLKSLLSITNRHSVVLMGMPTTLNCTGYDGGIHVSNSSDVSIKDLELLSCGTIYNDSLFREEKELIQKFFISSLYILKCTNVSLERLKIASSKGAGITMFDTDGSVKVHNCTFKNCSYNGDIMSGGSGLHIVLSYCTPRQLNGNYNCRNTFGREISESSYSIKDCSFHNNDAGPRNLAETEESYKYLSEGFSRGGGVCIIIDQNSTNNSIHIEDSDFINNTALWGGGLYIAVIGDSKDNRIEVENCTFNGNNVTEVRYKGGGVHAGFQTYNNAYPQNNSIRFVDSNFERNEAKIGGGLGFYSSVSATSAPNHMILQNCNWTFNVATLGSALTVTPQVWQSYVYDMKTEIIFVNCNFAHNQQKIETATMERYKSYQKGGGAIYAIGYRIIFNGTTSFESNADSAMYLLSTEVVFNSKSQTLFHSNHGLKGGAINMQSYSSLVLKDHVDIIFENNTAVSVGGAIHQHSSDKRDYFTSQSCFIKYSGIHKNITERKIKIAFKNNTIIDSPFHFGQSVFASTLKPCFDASNCKQANLSMIADTFSCIATVTFHNSNSSSEIATSGREARINNEAPIWVVPGKLFELPIEALDDLSQNVTSTRRFTVLNNSNVSVESAYTHTKKLIIFQGEQGEWADVLLESVHGREIVFKFVIAIQECPPGYILVKKRCVCSFNTEQKFSGIQSCNDTTFQAKLLHSNYWMGYDDREEEYGKEKDLLRSNCPLNHCLKDHNTSSVTLLPENTSRVALERLICREGRTGYLCSQCADGRAAHYHDPNYSCLPNNCTWGWLLYIVSEIVPVTMFFVVVMVLSIKFTDGAVMGFVLFFQISDTLLIRANGLIRFNAFQNNALEVYRVFSRIFSLNFFIFEKLSFCLWKSASTLDLLAFKYITIFYASTLVLAIVAVFRYCHSKKLNILLRFKGKTAAASTKSNIIHGVSGFLIVCYSECMRISFLILTPVHLYSGDENGSHTQRIVSFYNGQLKFYNGRYFLYAVPALLFVFALGILPPLLLISYPLCYRVLAFLKIGETRFAKVLCTCFPLEKFKPFFDSFQSSFKDEYRFFSGLYFLYRLTTLATFAFAELNVYYLIVQVQFTVIFVVHAVFQPYKQRWHNVLDSLLFANLSLINLMTLFNYTLTVSAVPNERQLNIVSSLQVVLLYMPLAYMVIYVAKSLLAWLHSSQKKIQEIDDYHEFSLTIAEEREELAAE